MDHDIYLDNSATTRVCPQAVEKALYMMTQCWGNPSSLHAKGSAAARELMESRRRIAAVLGAETGGDYVSQRRNRGEQPGGAGRREMGAETGTPHRDHRI